RPPSPTFRTPIAWWRRSMRRMTDGRTGGWAVGALAMTLVLLSAGPPARLSAQAPNNTSITVSANPVTAAPVIGHWPPVAGTASVQVFTITGLAVITATSTTARWQWDLTNADGQAVANGTYLIVVTLPDNTRLRRRLQ